VGSPTAAAAQDARWRSGGLKAELRSCHLRSATILKRGHGVLRQAVHVRYAFIPSSSPPASTALPDDAGASERLLRLAGLPRRAGAAAMTRCCSGTSSTPGWKVGGLRLPQGPHGSAGTGIDCGKHRGCIG